MTTDGNPPADAPGGGTPPAPTMPEGLPPQFWDATSGLKTEDFIKDYVGLKTAVDARVAARPEKPELYKADLPADFKAPEGFKVFDDKDPVAGPIMAEARKLAHEAGLDQATFSKLLGLQAQHQIAMLDAATKAMDAQMVEAEKQLGEKFQERKGAIESFVKGALRGDDKAKAAKYEALIPHVTSVAAFEALEDIIASAVTTRIPGRSELLAPPKPAVVPMKDRWYGDKQKAS